NGSVDPRFDGRENAKGTGAVGVPRLPRHWNVLRLLQRRPGDVAQGHACCRAVALLMSALWQRGGEPRRGGSGPAPCCLPARRGTRASVEEGPKTGVPQVRLG